MPRSNVIINAFTGGETAPEVWGRTETDSYPSAVEEMRNMFSNPRGGAVRRDGLHFVTPCKFDDRYVRLIPFIFSETQSYVMEFGDRYVRFFRDEGWVDNIGAVTVYTGDGGTTIYHYPHPEVLESDILVQLNGDDQALTTHYSVAVSDPLFNYISDFSVLAAWDLNYDDGDGVAANPWVNDGLGTVVSPAESTPILRHDATDFPRGGIADFHVNIDAFTLTQWPYSYSTIAEQLLTTEFTTTHQFTIDKNGKSLGLDYTCELAVKVNNQDTFTYQLIIARAGEPELVILTNTFLVDNDAGFTYTMPHLDFTDIEILPNDQIRMQWKVLSGGARESKITDTLARLEGNLTVDPDAKINYYSVQSNDVEGNTISVAPVVGQWDIALQHLAIAAYPLRVKFYTDEGLSVTFSGISAVQTDPGYEITMVTAPANGDVLLFADKSTLPGEDPIARNQVSHTTADGEHISRRTVGMGVEPRDIAEYIYEIESPFTHDELQDVYYVQANDQMWLCHVNHKPWRLTRHNAYDWRFEQPKYTGAPWEDGAYDIVDGYPRVVTMFQERLYFAATRGAPQTVWGSRSADFYDFAVPASVLPDSPVEYTIAAYTHEAIEWMSSERVLVIGTSATEHRLSPDQYVATDRLPTVSRMSAYGGAHIQPAFMGNMTVFVQASTNQIRSYEQSGQSVIEKWDSIRLDWMATHLTKNKVKEIAYALVPHSQLEIITVDGALLSMTYSPAMGDKSPVGWSKYDTDGKFISLAVIPEDNIDQTWVVTEREIDDVDNPGETKIVRHMEFFDEDVFTDGTLTYPEEGFESDPPIQSVSGLNHLEGKTVTVKVDGATHPDRVVVDGTIELNNLYQNIAIGLKYTPRLKLHRFAMAAEPAQLQGQLGRWVEVWLRLVESAYPLVDGVRAAERHPSTPMNQAEPLVTDDVKVYHLGFDREKQLIIEQDLPLPLHVTAVFGVLEVHQG